MPVAADHTSGSSPTPAPGSSPTPAPGSSPTPAPDSSSSPASSPVVAGSEREIVVETRGLGKIYRDFWGRKKVQALKALDLQVQKGEVFGLLGPNGSGKSTTIKLILGLLFPTSGRAFIFGKEATEVTKNERIGYLPDRICTSF
jgi:ABC-2 type transport system ATP-binding protein